MKEILDKNNVVLNAQVSNMEEAITLCGNVLCQNGYADEKYIDDMLEKEKVCPSYIGCNIAIPHGFTRSAELIKHSGVSVLQIPAGFQLDSGEMVYVVFGIAGLNDEHLQIMGSIAVVCSESSNIDKLRKAVTEEEIINILKTE